MQMIPSLGQDPTEKVPVHKALLLPDCRRPWRTWVDTSSWDDHAFFSRSGLQRYLLGSVARRETIRPFASPAAYQDAARTRPDVFHPHLPPKVLDASGGPPASTFLQLGALVTEGPAVLAGMCC